MIIGHGFYYFMPDIPWTRIPDRILAPVFLVAVGYNTGHRLSKLLLFAAALILVIDFGLLAQHKINILGTIILLRYTLEPVTKFLLQNKMLFWGAHIILIALFPFSNLFIEYGTLAYMLGIAGWMNKNGEAVSGHIVKPSDYFIFVTAVYLISQKIVFGYDLIGTFIIGVGLSIVMYMLYHMRELLMHSLKHKPVTIIGKFSKFLGHKSLEFYIAHILLFQAAYYFMTMR